MRDSKYLLPDNFETIKATEILAKEGFVVMPYMYPDLNVARDLANAGAACIMPLTQVSADRRRLARLWKWVLPQSWQTPLLQQPVMLR